MSDQSQAIAVSSDVNEERQLTSTLSFHSIATMASVLPTMPRSVVPLVMTGFLSFVVLELLCFFLSPSVLTFSIVFA